MQPTITKNKSIFDTEHDGFLLEAYHSSKRRIKTRDDYGAWALGRNIITAGNFSILFPNSKPHYNLSYPNSDLFAANGGIKKNQIKHFESFFFEIDPPKDFVNTPQNLEKEARRQLSALHRLFNEIQIFPNIIQWSGNKSFHCHIRHDPFHRFNKRKRLKKNACRLCLTMLSGGDKAVASNEAQLSRLPGPRKDEKGISSWIVSSRKQVCTINELYKTLCKKFPGAMRDAILRYQKKLSGSFPDPELYWNDRNYRQLEHHRENVKKETTTKKNQSNEFDLLLKNKFVKNQANDKLLRGLVAILVVSTPGSNTYKLSLAAVCGLANYWQETTLIEEYIRRYVRDVKRANALIRGVKADYVMNKESGNNKIGSFIYRVKQVDNSILKTIRLTKEEKNKNFCDLASHIKPWIMRICTENFTKTGKFFFLLDDLINWIRKDEDLTSRLIYGSTAKSINMALKHKLGRLLSYWKFNSFYSSVNGNKFHIKRNKEIERRLIATIKNNIKLFPEFNFLLDSNYTKYSTNYYNLNKNNQEGYMSEGMGTPLNAELTLNVMFLASEYFVIELDWIEELYGKQARLRNSHGLFIAMRKKIKYLEEEEFKKSARWRLTWFKRRFAVA